MLIKRTKLNKIDKNWNLIQKKNIKTELRILNKNNDQMYKFNYILNMYNPFITN